MGILDQIFSRRPKPGRPRPTTEAAFEQDILSSPIPVVVDFWSARCAPCQVMSGLLEEIGPQYAGKIEFFKLNLDLYGETAAEYGIRSVPTLVFFHEGTVIGQTVGLLPLQPLKERLNHLVRRADKSAGDPSPGLSKPDQDR